MLTDNAKQTLPDEAGWRKLRCKCSSLRQKSRFILLESEDQDDDEEEKTPPTIWLEVTCANCGNLLFYNGA